MDLSFPPFFLFSSFTSLWFKKKIWYSAHLGLTTQAERSCFGCGWFIEMKERWWKHCGLEGIEICFILLKIAKFTNESLFFYLGHHQEMEIWNQEVYLWWNRIICQSTKHSEFNISTPVDWLITVWFTLPIPHWDTYIQIANWKTTICTGEERKT